jgi:FAD:protein FMN transferase
MSVRRRTIIRVAVLVAAAKTGQSMRLSRIYVTIAGLLAAGAAATMLVVEREQPYRFQYENVLGTSMDLTVVASSERDAKTAESAVLTRVDLDAHALSAYDPRSEFSLWFQTRDEAVTVSPALFEILDLFDAWRTRTGGALDASAESVSRVWKTATDQGRVPTASELATAVARVRQTHWSLDPLRRTATHTSDTP